jgi:predicted dehydrogenase
LIRVGVIGIGFGQQVHVPAFRADPRCTVAALCASSLERAARIAERLGIPKAVGAWEELVSDPGVDVVSIAVPPALQSRVACAAAQQGKHVFCEKPAAASAAEAAAMLEAATQARVAHAIDFEFPEIPQWRQAREIVAAGRLGPLRHAAFTWRLETMSSRAAADTWKRDPGRGGGTLNSFASHAFHHVEWLLGRIGRVLAHLRAGGRSSEAGVEIWAELRSGQTVTVAIATDAFLGPGHRIEVYGEEGTLVLENAGRDLVRDFTLRVGDRAAGTFRELSAGWRPDDPAADGRVMAVEPLVRRFVDRVEAGVAGGSAAAPSLAHGLRVQELLEAARRSHAQGTWQAV